MFDPYRGTHCSCQISGPVSVPTYLSECTTPCTKQMANTTLLKRSLNAVLSSHWPTGALVKHPSKACGECFNSLLSATLLVHGGVHSHRSAVGCLLILRFSTYDFRVPFKFARNSLPEGLEVRGA